MRLQTGRVCLCIWNITLLLLSYFCSWELQLFKCLPCYRSVCANELYISWKFWLGETLNIINQWEKPQKRGNQIFKVEQGVAKEMRYNFWLKLSGRKNLGGNNVLTTSFRISRKKYFYHKFLLFQWIQTNPFHPFNDQNLPKFDKSLLLMLAYIDPASMV